MLYKTPDARAEGKGLEKVHKSSRIVELYNLTPKGYTRELIIYIILSPPILLNDMQNEKETVASTGVVKWLAVRTGVTRTC